MHGHTHYMNTLVMYTHIRAVANVCLSVCLALRGAVLIDVKQYVNLCCTVCGRIYSAPVTISAVKVNTADTKRQYR